MYNAGKKLDSSFNFIITFSLNKFSLNKKRNSGSIIRALFNDAFFLFLNLINFPSINHYHAYHTYNGVLCSNFDLTYRPIPCSMGKEIIENVRDQWRRKHDSRQISI